MARKYWDEIEVLSRTDLRKIQGEKLAKKVGQVFNCSPFFQRKLKEAGIDPSTVKSVEDLQRLPFTTRDELVRNQREHAPFGQVHCIGLDKAALVGRSGVSFSRSANRINVMASHGDVRRNGSLLIRALWAGGIRASEKVYIAEDPRYNIVMGYIPRAMCDLGATMVFTGAEKAARNARYITKMVPPQHYFLYPTYAQYLSGVIREEENRDLPVRSIFGWGEPGYSIPGTRQRLKERWSQVAAGDLNIIDVYVMTEGGVLGYGCGRDDGALHGFEDAVIYEVIDPDSGAPVGAGERGELVITHLEGEGLPLLRYRTGDVTTIDEGPCTCGRTHVKLRGVDRLSERLTVRGKPVYANDVEDILRQMGEAGDNFRIVANGKDSLRVLLNPLGADRQSAIASRLERDLGVPVEIETRSVEEMPRYIHRSHRLYDDSKASFYDDIHKTQAQLEV
ncbi:MAG: phenylacetate--CoA ligase family protein [Chloroflexi bacterium]|nr:phenylacetate--CoA ligase family protein [Chloroflexota bacterium]